MMDRLLVGLTRGLVGAQPRWIDVPPPIDQQCLYFANHTSHLDALAIWSAFPTAQRRRVRPVAATDYWGKGGIRSHIAHRVLHAVYVDRKRIDQQSDPLVAIDAALASGDSIIMFPEGTLGRSRLPAPFKSGLFHLAQRHPEVRLIPTYLDTLHRSLPKGCFVPLPIHCIVHFGAPISLVDNEEKDAFLARAHASIVALAGPEDWT